MALEVALSKLASPVKDLALSVTQNASLYVGESDKDKAEVVGWVDRVAQGDLAKEGALKELDSQLIPRTYIVSNYFTAADVALYGALYPAFSTMQPPQYYAHPSLMRYFDHVQSHTAVRKAVDSLALGFALISFDLAGAPKSERKSQPAKKKEKTAAAANVPQPSSVAKNGPQPGVVPSDNRSTEVTGGKGQKKEKKKSSNEVGGKAGGKAAAAAVEDAGDPVPSMIDLRVGHIVDVKKHPDADGLYVEQIDLGEETGPRTIVSGLVHYIPIEQMHDKYVIVICNLKPASMRGVKSFGMVLAATSKDGKEGGIELVESPPNSKPGDRVYFEGAEFENATPLTQLNPKKKIFETIQPSLTTLDTKEAAWINPVTKSVHRIRTQNGVCYAPTFVGASLS